MPGINLSEVLHFKKTGQYRFTVLPFFFVSAACAVGQWQPYKEVACLHDETFCLNLKRWLLCVPGR